MQAKQTRRRLSPLLVLTIVAVAVPLSGAYPAGTAAGEIRSTGRPHGDFVVRAAECYSWGDLWSSDVWVITELERPLSGGTGFRGGLLIEQDGPGRWRAVTENPNGCSGFKCPQRAVDPRRCKRFDVVSETRGWLWRRRGHARLDCSFPEGGTLEADLTFSGCAHVLSSSADADP
ncbi:MAG: hypothetical protein JW940_29270 [Polyangiaceae bacterium]|nr:hypothetical protein [Polyangiaceae bacterium]